MFTRGQRFDNCITVKILFAQNKYLPNNKIYNRDRTKVQLSPKS